MKNLLLSLVILLGALISNVKAYTVMTDNFTNGFGPLWHSIDSNATGSPWNTLTDSTSPLSGTAITNPVATTQIVQQWDTRTLVKTNDYIQVTMSVRTLATQTAGTFNLTLLNTPTAITGDTLGYSAYPLASVNGYSYTQSYGSSFPVVQRVTNNAGTTIGTGTSGALLGNAAGHTVILRATKVAAGIQIQATIDTVVTTVIDSSPSGYVFNAVRIDAGGIPINVDNVTVVSTLPSTTFTFTLPHAYTTSAGVYDSTGKLVRNLWRKLPLQAGSYTRSWNNTNDAGAVVAAGTYTIKVLYHNMNYTWEGVIGNSASSFTSNVWRSLLGPSSMSIDASGHVFVTLSYDEGLTDIVRCTTSAIQAPVPAMPADAYTVWQYVATDGTNYYMANTGVGWDQNNCTFVAAYKVSDGTAYTFSSGVNGQTSGTDYPSVTDFSQEINSPVSYDAAFVTAHQASGLAVQASGSLLAVSHAGQNQVRLFNKTTGALVNTISVTAPGQVAFAPSGDLWVLTGTSAVRYTSLSTTPTVATTITGFSSPLAVAVSPADSNVVLVADGGTSQQVQCYNSTGTSQWTLGQAGGYTSGPSVSTNKFWFETFDPLSSAVKQTFLAFQPDGSFWVGDTANDRILHFSSARVYQGQIISIPDRLGMTVDQNNPTRVFSGLLEYQVDYTKPLLPGDPDTTLGGNGSWKLVNNWEANIDRTHYNNFFYNVATLSNGRTYAQVYDLMTTQFMSHVVELPATGSMRDTGLYTYFSYNLYGNGDLRYCDFAGSGNPYTQTIHKQALTGFDASGNPQWAAATTLATTPCNFGPEGTKSALDPYNQGGWGMTSRFPITSSNIIPCFNATASSSEPNTHLGGVVVGGTDYLWKSNAGAQLYYPDGLGFFCDLDNFGGHDGIAAFADGRDVLTGYDGQYGSYSNQFIHYYDDGLFVGQYGVAWTTDDVCPGLAGNIASAFLANSAGTKYLYCVDESEHGGLHRWRMDGTVAEITASGALNATDALGTAAAWPTTTNLVINPGFESEEATSTLSGQLGYALTPIGWQVNNGTTGNGAGAFYTEWTNSTARSLPYHATIAKSSNYTVQPYQILTGLPSGTYKLTAWIKSSGGQTSATMYCKKTPLSATVNYSTAIPTAAAWTQITISGISITAGKAEIGFNVQGAAGQYIYIDDVSFSSP